MGNPITVLELTSNSVKLLVGYELERQPIVLYAGTIFVDGAVTEGEIINQDELIAAINKLVKDASTQLEIKIDEVILALPSINLEVYTDSQQTNVLANTLRVEHIDIKNVLSLVRKQRIDPNKTIISIVPERYILDNEKTSVVSPIGETSSFIAINCYVHLLPLWVYNRYLSVVQAAGIKVTKTFVDSYALTELIALEKDASPNYLLVDYGSRTTTISLVGNHRLFYSRIVNLGGDHLTERIAKELSLTLEEAHKLKHMYGYDNRASNYKVAIAHQVNEYGQKHPIYQKDLNRVIEAFMNEHYAKIKDAVASLEASQSLSNIFELYPLYFTGGASQINGFNHLLEHSPLKDRAFILNLKAIGARNSRYAVCLGLLRVYNRYILDIGDERSEVGVLTRD